MKRHALLTLFAFLSALAAGCGSDGSDGDPGEPGAPGDPGPEGPPGPVDETPPPAPTDLRVVASPDGPPSYELKWNMPASEVPVQTFIVYEAAASFASEADALVTAVEPEPARSAIIPLRLGTGARHFRVQAVSFTGVAGPLSAEIFVDTASRMVFLADKEANDVFELWSVLAGSTAEPTKLSGPLVAGGDVDRLFFSPDGRHVVFSADKETDGLAEIYVVPADGSAAPVKVSGTPVAGGAPQPFFIEFSPDGSRVAFTGDLETDEVFELFVADLAGSSRIKVSGILVANGDVDVDEFAWSPDGTRIAFLADKELDTQNELFVGPADGSAEPIKVSGALVASGQVEAFQWNTDAQRLAIRASKETVGFHEAYVCSAAGGEPFKVSGTLPAFAPVNTDPLWSPDGSRLAFSADILTNGVFEVFVVAVDVPGVVSRVSGNSQAFSDIINFKWSPDSTKLAFNMDKNLDNADEVFVADVLGGAEPIRLSGAHITDEEAFNVLWSPSGDRVAWFSDANGVDNRFEAFTAQADRPNSAVLVSGVLSPVQEVFQYAWAPDGTRLMLVGDFTTDGISDVYLTNAAGGATPLRQTGTLVVNGAVGSSFFGFTRLGN